jgi:hypothetical protein
VRQQPYQVVFSAIDNFGLVQLQDYETMFITVVAPAPQNPSATPDGNVMQLAWDPSICGNANGYKIYRRQGSYGFVHGNCETGVPAYTGYQLIGSTSGVNSTSFTDAGLAFGITYCYMVVATFPDFAESYASIEFCSMLERDVPIMTHVSVGVTDNTTGVDTVRWSNAYDLDTVQHPGPYQFKLFRGDGLNMANTLIHTSTLSNFLAHPDTAFTDIGLDTRTIRPRLPRRALRRQWRKFVDRSQQHGEQRVSGGGTERRTSNAAHQLRNAVDQHAIRCLTGRSVACSPSSGSARRNRSMWTPAW